MQNQSSRKGKRRPSSANTDTIRINLTISKALLERVDEAAKQDYTTRSDIIRVGLLWYLRPQGRDLDQTDPDTVLKMLNQRRAKAYLNKVIKENNIGPDDD